MVSVLSLRHHIVVSISQISRDFGMKQDVRESLWCLWYLLTKSHEISARNEICERVHARSHITNSLAHLVSCRNVTRFD